MLKDMQCEIVHPFTARVWCHKPVYTSTSNWFQFGLGQPLSVNHIMDVVWPNQFKRKLI